MLQIEYTAKRSLKAGHFVDTLYIINTELTKQDRTFSAVGNQSVSLSGNTFSVIHRRDEIYALESQIVTAATTPDIDDMIEFLDSVSSGETFRMDLSGVLENYVFESLRRPYRAVRLGKDEIYRYSFRARRIA